MEAATRLVAPMMPHLAEAMYANLHPGTETLVADLAWLSANPAWTAVETVTIAVQVMGKLRATIEMPPGAAADTVVAAAAAEPNVARMLEGRRVVKRVHVPDRIVNFVVAG
jgi:leucyl-tRNA synthetase